MNHAMTWKGRALDASVDVGKSEVVEDNDLVARARAGDPVAFERLYEQYHAPILNYLHRMVGDRTLAEDLAQDSFEKAYRGLPKTREDLAFKAWLYRIATNVAISYGRRKKIVKWIPFDLGREYAGGAEVEGTATRRHDVQGALAQIPEHYASVLLLRHYQGMSVKEAADVLDITEAACKLRLFRARKAFAEVYRGPQPGDPEVAEAMQRGKS